MASALAKFFTTTILGRRQHRKIAIIGLHDAGGMDLLKRLCGGTVQEKRGDRIGCLVYTGTSSALKCDFDFVAVEVGGGDKYRLWRAAQYNDADGFIWVVDASATEVLVEAREEMGVARMGKMENQAAVRPEAPWLVLVDFKQNPLSIAEAERQAELVIIAAGDNLDWTFRAVSTTTSEGLREATEWLYHKVK